MNLDPDQLDEIVIPQPFGRKAMCLMWGFLCVVVGALGGIDKSGDAAAIWYIAAAGWFGSYLWAVSKPILTLSADQVVYRRGPFTGGYATVESISDVTVGEDSIVIAQTNGLTLNIPLYDIPGDQRPAIVQRLVDFGARADELDRRKAEEFEETWGVDPEQASG